MYYKVWFKDCQERFCCIIIPCLSKQYVLGYFRVRKEKRTRRGRISRRFRIEFGNPDEIIRKYSETAWKFGLCHFSGRKKCENLNFVIFYVGKSAESWTLLFLLAKKGRKVGLCHFYWRKKLGKLNFIISNGGKRCGKLDFVIFDGGKVWKIDCNISWLE